MEEACGCVQNITFSKALGGVNTGLEKIP